MSLGADPVLLELAGLKKLQLSKENAVLSPNNVNSPLRRMALCWPQNRGLLPLNGSRWFGTDVINYPIDAFNIVDDFTRHFGQKLVGQMAPFGSHPVY